MDVAREMLAAAVFTSSVLDANEDTDLVEVRKSVAYLELDSPELKSSGWYNQKAVAKGAISEDRSLVDM